MDDERFTPSGRMLFSVRKHSDQYIVENICGTLMDKPPLMDLADAFPAQVTKRIIKKCCLTLSGQTDSDSFLADIGYGEPYNITLIHSDQSTVFFSATPLTHSAGDPTFSTLMPRNFKHMSYFFDICNHSDDGMFIWQVSQSTQFLLVYANLTYCQHEGLSCNALGKTLEEIYSKKRAIQIRSQLKKCMQSEQSVSFKYERGSETLSISLYPAFEDNNMKRIMGKSTNITAYVNKTHELECANKQLIQSDVSLRKQLRFEAFISRTTRELMDGGHSDFSSCTDKLICELGKILDVSTACVWKNDDALYGTSSQWCADKTVKDIDLFHAALHPGFGTWINQFRSGRIAVINDVEKENPALFSSLLYAAQKDDLCSILIVPILRGGDLWGVICVAQLHKKRLWTTVEIGMLKTAADTIMSAYLRMKIEQQLNESNRVLVEYDECLQDMLSVQESLTNVSRQFTITGVNEFAASTVDMLTSLGELTDVDRTYIHIFNSKSGTFEWRKKGMAGLGHISNAVSVSNWLDFLQDRDLLTINNTTEESSNIPSFLLDSLLCMGVKSVLIIPIREQGATRGVMVLSKVLGCHNWNNTHIQTAKMFSDVFLSAYLRMCKEQQLLSMSQSQSAYVHETIKQAELSQKILRCSQTFVDATEENLSSIFTSICKEIAELLQIHSISLTRYSEEYTKTCIVLDWASGRLSRRTGSVFSHHDNTMMNIPVLYHKSVWGSLLVNYSGEKPTDVSVDTLGLLGEYCIRAYMRIYPDSQHCFECNSERTGRTKLTLAPQPAAI